MTRLVAVHLRAPLCAALTLLAPVPCGAAQAPPSAPAVQMPATAAPSAFPDVDADTTRRRLGELLRQLPLPVTRALRSGPSLLLNDTYLAPYPSLSAFVRQRPEVGRSPGHFVGEMEFRERTGAWVALVLTASVAVYAARPRRVAGRAAPVRPIEGLTPGRTARTIARVLPRIAMGLALACTPSLVFAQPLIDHLRLIAPAAPGGGWDQTARAMQAALQASGLARTSSVENVPGAAGTIGLARFISAERGRGDVLMVSGLIMLGAIVTHQSPVTLREVTPIARLVGEYEVLVVPASSPFRTLSDLVAAFRAEPEAVSWGGGSAGGTDQILAGLFADALGVNPARVNYIAYSGGGEALSAILGGQVSAGVSGLAEQAPHIDAGTVRALAISSADRLPGVDVPTFREQGVDLEIENWRSIVAPPGIGIAERTRLEQLIEAMVRSDAWAKALAQYRWNDRYLAGTSFARFAVAEEARVQGILARLGTGQSNETAAAGIGRYPWFVFAGLIVTGILTTIGLVRAPPPSVSDGASRPAGRTQWLAVALIAAAAALDVALLERAGFVLASALLCWLTARAFDRSRPMRDAVVATMLAVAAYALFARVLQIDLPAGVLAGLG